MVTNSIKTLKMMHIKKKNLKRGAIKNPGLMKTYYPCSTEEKNMRKCVLWVKIL